MGKETPAYDRGNRVVWQRGDKVRCVNALGAGDQLAVGAVYTVFRDDPYGLTELEELRDRRVIGGFRPDRFISAEAE